MLTALAFLAGIVLASAFLYFPWTALTILFLASSAAAWSFRQDRLALRTISLLSATVLCAAGLTVHAVTYLPEDHYTRTIALDGTLRRTTGTVVSPLERERGRTAFLLAVSSIDGRSTTGTVRVVLKEEQPSIGYGDRAEIEGKFYPVRGYRNPGGFDYPAYLGRQGVFAVLSVRTGSTPLVNEQGSGLFRTMQDWRERIRQALLRSTSGQGSAVLQAMILGEEGGLTNDLRDIFLSAGATHILSISGSHLGLVAVFCFWLAKGLFFLLPERFYHRLTIVVDPRKAAALLAVVPIVFYALLAGGQQATIRSLIMLIAGFTALLLDREHAMFQALAIAGLIILVPDPQAAFDISFQLSFLSVAAILFVVNTASAVAPAAVTWRERVKRDAFLMLAVSLAATIATAPLVAYYFNRLSLWGILSNMIIVPFAGFLVVPLGLLSGVLSLVLGSLPFPGLNQWAGDAFVALTSFFAGLPGATAAYPAPGAVFAVAYTGLILSAAWFIRRRLLSAARPFEHPAGPSVKARVVALASFSLLVLSLVLPLLRNNGDRLVFLDVGQGDCCLLETSEGKRILIDGGGAVDNRFDVGQKVVAPFLGNRNIGTIDLAVLSHPHPDHMNGLASLLRTVAVREVWTSGQDLAVEGYEDLRKTAEERGTILRAVDAGHTRSWGRTAIEVLHPGRGFDRAGRRAYEAENNRSLVIRVSINNRRLLFPGDIHKEAERFLARTNPDLRSDLLKIPHHGSKSSSTDGFIAAVRPSIAVMSVGAGNPYRQPSNEVVDRYLGSGIRLYRTDQDGAVLVSLDKGGLSVIPWDALILRRIRPGEPGSWFHGELENWKRLWIRREAT